MFETTVDEPKIGSLGGAGRYDGLVGMFSGQDIPATGMSLGLERIIDVAEELELLNFSTSVSEVLVTVFDAEHTHRSLELATRLRRAGIRTEVYVEEGRNIGRQHQYAERRGMPYSIVIGPEDVARSEAVIRDIKTRRAGFDSDRRCVGLARGATWRTVVTRTVSSFVMLSRSESSPGLASATIGDFYCDLG